MTTTHAAGRRGRRQRVAASVPLIVTAMVATIAPLVSSDAAATEIPRAADAGVPSSTLYPTDNLFPDGTGDNRAVVRDCGFSAPLPNGQSLWVFCDTAIYDGIRGDAPDLSATIRFVHSGTAALAGPTTEPSPSNPVELHEAAFPNLPTRFITSSGMHGPPGNRQTVQCAADVGPFAWTKGMVTLPGTTTVVAFFQDHCPDQSSGYASYDIGVAEVVFDDVDPTDFSAAASITTTSRFDSVQVNPAPATSHSWGHARGPVIHGDHLYVYKSTPSTLDCSTGTCVLVERGLVGVARTLWAAGEYRFTDSYEYYTGNDLDPWSSDPAAAANILPDTNLPSGDGLSVAWHRDLQRYVMSHGASHFSPTQQVSLRTAVTPWGPWSSPVNVPLDASSSYANATGGCDAPTACRTFILHPELSASGSGDVHLSYIRNNDMATSDGQVITLSGRPTLALRLARVPGNVLPLSAPQTALLDAPSGHTDSKTAVIEFNESLRPANAVDAAATPVADHYRCEVDNVVVDPCTSPLLLDELDPGPHVATIAAVSANGAADPTPVTVTWTVDDLRPTTSIVEGPASPSTPGDSHFTFSGNDDHTPTDDLRYECALDDGAFEPCTREWTASDSTTGERELRVRAVDLAGNVDPNPATWSWYVDMAPSISFTFAPDLFTRQTTAHLWFALTDDLTSRYALHPECSLDGAAFEPCSAPVSYYGLPEGPHSFSVRVIDGTGNTALATHDWSVDRTSPEPPTLDGPSSHDNQPNPTFSFSSTDDHSTSSDLTFLCSLDYDPYEPCGSSTTFEQLSAASHRLGVRTVDQAGNVSAASIRSWLVDVEPPTVAITSGPSDGAGEIAATFSFTGSDDRTWTPDLRYVCSLDNGAEGSCERSTSFTELMPGPHSLTVRSLDRAGNYSEPTNWAWDIAFVAANEPPPPGVAGEYYEHAFTTNAPEDAPWTTWQLTDGELPWGMHVWGGALSGTPQAAGSFGPLTVTGTSSLGTIQQTFTLQVVDSDSVVGTVQHAATGEPVAGIRVRAYNSHGWVVSAADTAIDGSYSLGYLRPGTYRIGFVDLAGGYVSSFWNDASKLADATPVEVTDGTVARIDAAMVPLHTIAGSVTNELTGAPLADMWVVLYGESDSALALRKTDANGYYRFRSLADGTYRLHMLDPAGGHRATYWNGATDLSAATPITLHAGSSAQADASLLPLTTITGMVTGQSNGAAVPGAWVVLRDPAGTNLTLRVTGNDGRYTFAGVTPATYHLLVIDPTGTYVTEYWSGATTLGGSTPLHATGGVIEASPQLVQTNTVSGAITDAVHATPISNIRVTLVDAEGAGITQTTTDAQGRYRFANIRPGAYRLSFGDPSGNYAAQYWEGGATLDAATAITLDGGIDAVANAALDPLTVISGVVTSTSTELPIAGAWVSLFNGDGVGVALTLSDASGAFRFGKLRPGDYRVRFGDPTGAHIAAYWLEAATLEGATPIVAAGSPIVLEMGLRSS